MLRLASCSLLAIASLVAGSWVGLGQPTAREAARIAARAERSLGVSQIDVRGAALPPEHLTPEVDVAQLPDPMPFPRLNPDESTRRAWLLAEGPAHAPGDGRRIVTFTFDDGPFPETTPTILEILAQHRVRGTFFWIGRYLDGNDDRAVTTRAVARQVAAAGHFIGNHTHDHLKLTAIGRAAALAQIDDGAASIARVLGTRPTLFRPPYGALDPWESEALRARGGELVLWSIEAEDMTHGDAASMTDSLREQIEFAGGGIVLLHDIRPTTIPVLSALLEWLGKHRWDPSNPAAIGYEVVDLAAYLQETARSQQPFADRPALEKARSAAWRREHPRARKSLPPSVVRVSTEASIDGASAEDGHPLPL